MATTTAEEIEGRFPPNIRMPEELRHFCSWVMENGYPISGCFKLRSDYYEAVKYWFGKDDFVHRFGMFGAGADGSLHNLWVQDDGKVVVVHMGSEGDSNFVLAENFKDFLRLLAIGYSELGFDDLSKPPAPEGINPKFQQWVRDTYKVTIPTLGSEIIVPAKERCQDFTAWIEQAVSA